MNPLDSAAKAAKQFEKIMKSTIKPEEVGAISDAAKKAGLDAIKTRNIFSNGMTRKEFIDEIHNTINTSRTGNRLTPANYDKLAGLLGGLHPKVKDNLVKVNPIDASRKIANIIQHNPTLSATDVGHILHKHLNKGHTVGKFSHNYLTHVVNTPTADRPHLHKIVNILTSTKDSKVMSNYGNFVKRVEKVPAVPAKVLYKMFPAVPKNVLGRKSISSRHDYLSTEIHKASEINKYVGTIRKYASRIKDTDTRAKFWTAVYNELKSPTGKNIAGIFKEVNGGVK